MSSTPERRRPHQAVRRTKAGSSQNGNSNIADPELAFIAALVDSCEDAIVGTDLDGIIRTWNPAAERLYGYRAEEIIGAPLSTLSPEVQNETAALLNRIRSGERINRQPAVRRKQDGQLIPVDIAASPVRDP